MARGRARATGRRTLATRPGAAAGPNSAQRVVADAGLRPRIRKGRARLRAVCQRGLDDAGAPRRFSGQAEFRAASPDSVALAARRTCPANRSRSNLEERTAAV